MIESKDASECFMGFVEDGRSTGFGILDSSSDGAVGMCFGDTPDTTHGCGAGPTVFVKRRFSIRCA